MDNKGKNGALVVNMDGSQEGKNIISEEKGNISLLD